MAVQISAKDVAELRKKTGCGMMECKKALVEAEGNFEEAVKVLREKGLSVAAKKADRIAAEGVVDILVEGNTAAIIEVNSETDFVAKNDTFKEFVKNLLKTIIADRPASVEELLAKNYAGTDMTVDAKLKDMIFTIGENMNIRRFDVADGILSTYIHGNGQTGIIITFEADDACVKNPGFAEFAKNIALQCAAMPVLYLDPASVPAADIEEEKQVLIAQIKNDPKNASKPENILEKMVSGKIGKFYEKNCLTEQAYVKDDDMTVGEYVKVTAKAFGGDIKIKSYIKYEKGEGIEKRNDDLAAEVAKLVEGK